MVLLLLCSSDSYLLVICGWLSHLAESRLLNFNCTRWRVFCNRNYQSLTTSLSRSEPAQYRYSGIVLSVKAITIVESTVIVNFQRYFVYFCKLATFRISWQIFSLEMTYLIEPTCFLAVCIGYSHELSKFSSKLLESARMSSSAAISDIWG
jgi:hypothetical protein